MKRLIRVLSSLKLGIIVIVLLTLALICATVAESIYDTPTAQYWVYRSFWFYGILAGLGLVIFFVAVSRWPWKKHHTAFLLAHAGILILLFGALVTDIYGLDGMLRVAEGESSSAVEINEPILALSDNTTVQSVKLGWIPPNKKFKPRYIKDYNITVDQFISHADPQISFIPNTEPGKSGFPAIRVRLSAEMMKISQEYWLWGGDPSWRRIQAGPATLALLSDDLPNPPVTGGPVLSFRREKNGDLTAISVSSDGKSRTEKIPEPKIKGTVIQPGWRGGVKITVDEYLPDAISLVNYTPSFVQYGNNAPPSAIHVISGKLGESPNPASMWLGLGDRATLQTGGREIALAYFPKRVNLPFAIRLHQFKIDHYEGTRNPSEFSSVVSVMSDKTDSGGAEEKPIVISMNEPLEHNGITFYQASYEDALPRPTVSIFSVNRDPGRFAKYFGSLLIVLGTILLFAEKLKKARVAQAVRTGVSPNASKDPYREINL